MQWKKGVGILSAFGMSASLLGMTQGTSAFGAARDNTHHIKLVEVITSPQRTTLLKSMLAQFEKQNPGIQVDLISLPWESSAQQFLAMVQGGQAPDVAEMPDKWIGQYAAMNDLEDLTPYINTWSAKNEMTPLFWNAAKIYNNKPYVLPYGFYVRALYYNRTVFGKTHLKPPATFPQFLNEAKTLTNASKGQYGYDLRGGPGAFDSIDLFLSSYLGTGNWFNAKGQSLFNSPAAVKGFTDLVNLYKKHYAPPGSITWGFNEIVNAFYTGHGMMLDQDPDTLESVEQNMKSGTYGTAPLPIGPKGVTFPKLGFASWSMFSSSQYKNDDWKLISFLENYDNAKKWEQFAHIVPIYKKAQKDKDFNDPALKAWFTESNDAKHYKTSFYPFQLPELAQFLDQISVTDYQKVLQGSMTPKQALDKWAAFLTAAEQKWMKSNNKG